MFVVNSLQKMGKSSTQRHSRSHVQLRAAIYSTMTNLGLPVPSYVIAFITREIMARFVNIASYIYISLFASKNADKQTERDSKN